MSWIIGSVPSGISAARRTAGRSSDGRVRGLPLPLSGPRQEGRDEQKPGNRHSYTSPLTTIIAPRF